jgi:hypothetical protein
MRIHLYFIAALTALETIAGICYFWEGDWRRGTYWVLAAAMSVIITI